MAYLLDANIFIQAKRLHYGLDFRRARSAAGTEGSISAPLRAPGQIKDRRLERATTAWGSVTRSPPFAVRVTAARRLFGVEGGPCGDIGSPGNGSLLPAAYQCLYPRVSRLWNCEGASIANPASSRSARISSWPIL